MVRKRIHFASQAGPRLRLLLKWRFRIFIGRILQFFGCHRFLFRGFFGGKDPWSGNGGQARAQSTDHPAAANAISFVHESSAIGDGVDTSFLRAMRAAVHFIVRFDPVPDDAAITMRAFRGEPMDCAFETIEGVIASIFLNDERLVVIVPAHVASCHIFLLCLIGSPAHSQSMFYIDIAGASEDRWMNFERGGKMEINRLRKRLLRKHSRAGGAAGDRLRMTGSRGYSFITSAMQFGLESTFMESIASKDPREHTANIRKEFRELIDHLREDIGKVDEPKAQALFETAAEVLSGLDTAFKDYEEKSEEAWK
jgi:hypothetical protein